MSGEVETKKVEYYQSFLDYVKNFMMDFKVGRSPERE
jgi:hypothetical protein